MEQSAVEEKILDLCPNILIAKNFMSWGMEQRFKSYYIPEKERKLGEVSACEKRKIVKKYMAKRKDLKDMVVSGKKILSTSMSYVSKVERNDILIDMIFCRLAYGFLPDEYLCFDLTNQTPEERRTEWISDIDRYVAMYQMNNPKDMNLLHNKARTLKLFRNYYDRDAIHIKTQKDYPEFEKFVKKHPVFVKKNVFASMGNSVELVDITSIETTQKEYFEQLIQTGEYILEEKIRQSNDLSALNPSSVNTVRCITFRTRSGVVTPFAFMKIGKDNKFVDNGAAGGILTGINHETGILDTNGYDENNVKYIRHPDTGIAFQGYQLPEWDNLINLCKKLAERLTGIQCVGWDLAHTDKGWVIVEANGKTQFIVPQIVYKRGMKKELNRIMSNMNLIK